MSRLLALLATAGRAFPPRAPVFLPVPGGGGRLQQPVHVADAAAALLTAVERPGTAGSCYDIAGPEPVTFAELLCASAAAVGCRARLLPVPLAPVIALTRCYEWLSSRPKIRAEQWQRLAEDKAFPIDAARRDLEFAPRPLAEGIHQEAVALGLGTSLVPPDHLAAGTVSESTVSESTVSDSTAAGGPARTGTARAGRGHW
jgi:nucleoside-diphosphate-sugar epimerase